MAFKKLEHLVLSSLTSFLLESALSSCTYESDGDKETEDRAGGGTIEQCIPCIEYKNEKDDDCDGVVDNRCPKSEAGPNGPYRIKVTSQFYSLVQFPSPLYSNGVFYGKIVVGQNASIEELQGAQIIADSIKEFLAYCDKCDELCQQEATKIYKEDEIQDYRSEYLILVGTPCTSTLLWELIDPKKITYDLEFVDGPTQQDDCLAVGNFLMLQCERERGLLTSYGFTPGGRIVVATGNTSNGALLAAKILADHNDYDLNCGVVYLEKSGGQLAVDCIVPPNFDSNNCILPLIKQKEIYCEDFFPFPF